MLKIKTSIYLLGFMGCGKSYWGRRVAAHFGMEFIDLDDFIEEREGETVREIFKIKGENYFRKAEQEALRAVAQLENKVISLGGGTPCFFENMDVVTQSGISFYLKTSVSTLQERLVNEAHQRPLIAAIPSGELAIFIKNKLDERAPFYEKATIIIDTERENVIEIIQEILKK